MFIYLHQAQSITKRSLNTVAAVFILVRSIAKLYEQFFVDNGNAIKFYTIFV